MRILGGKQSLWRRGVYLVTAAVMALGVVPVVPADAATCPCSIWPSTATPADASVSDPDAVELGVKFKADADGSITGIRFYKGAGNTGTHTGTLWSGTGAKLATATFQSETASGWQQVNFAQPVGVVANQTYLASYYAPNGNYAATSQGLAGVIDNSPLHTIAGGGVYKYGASGFPVSSFENTNYWVDVVYSTTIVAPPADPLAEGPGGPILLVTAPDRPFSKYYAEILRAEGLNSFKTVSLADVTATMLGGYDVVVLGEMPLTAAQVTLLSNWVNAGGNLIAMRPDKQLSSLLGLTDQSATLSEGYMLPDVSQAPGAGITNQTMQFHGTADRYTVNAGTTSVASLYSNATAATSNPAVSVRSVGSNGGQAAAFTYDLARSVVYTHQGNPAWAGQERDGSLPIRPNDLFYGAKAGDTQPDYVNLNKVAIPQADEQQRLLANTIAYVNADKKPLAKFWYLPKGVKAAVLMTGDDHTTTAGTKTTFNRLLANSPAGCNLANWECFRATSWIYTNTAVTNAEAASYAAQGFDIGVHVSTGCNNWTAATLGDSFANDIAGFGAKYTSLPAQHGSRTHCIVWSDWATQPKVEYANGIRIDLNYYYWPGSWVQNRPGFMNGNGIPMRFADSDGSMIDVYQAPSHLVNESGQTFPANINTMLDRALGSEGYYGVFGTHYDYTDSFDQQLMESARARNLPLVSAQQVLDWTDARNASSISTSTWAGNSVTYGATVDAKAGSMMRLMVPFDSTKGSLTSVVNGTSPVTYTTETIKGVKYAMVPVTTGSYTATYGVADPNPVTNPTVTATTPANGATGVVQTTTVTATFSEAMNAATITDNTLRLSTSGGAAVAATVSYNAATNTATLAPTSALAADTVYNATVVSGANGVKSQLASEMLGDKTWSFTTQNSGSPNCPCSLWPTTTTPANITSTDKKAVTVGVKFRSDVAGKITGIRFYKGPNNTGTHVVRLWSSSRTALASATASNESASGWQTVPFASAVTIAANTTYIASYYAPKGSYSYNDNYFTTSRDNGMLHAPASTTGNTNGVYTYGTGIRFPANTFQATNYWVDPIFTQ